MGYYPRLRLLRRADYWLTCPPFSEVTCLIHSLLRMNGILWVARGMFSSTCSRIHFLSQHKENDPFSEGKDQERSGLTWFLWAESVPGRNRSRSKAVKCAPVSADELEEAGNDSEDDESHFLKSGGFSRQWLSFSAQFGAFSYGFTGGRTLK